MEFGDEDGETRIQPIVGWQTNGVDDTIFFPIVLDDDGLAVMRFSDDHRAFRIVRQ